MKLAKECIDIGIYTNQREEQLAFWQNKVGLPFEELLKVGTGDRSERIRTYKIGRASCRERV